MVVGGAMQGHHGTGNADGEVGAVDQHRNLARGEFDRGSVHEAVRWAT